MSCEIELRKIERFRSGKIELGLIFKGMAAEFGSEMTAFLEPPINMRGSFLDTENPSLVLGRVNLIILLGTIER